MSSPGDRKSSPCVFALPGRGVEWVGDRRAGGQHVPSPFSKCGGWNRGHSAGADSLEGQLGPLRLQTPCPQHGTAPHGPSCRAAPGHSPGPQRRDCKSSSAGVFQHRQHRPFRHSERGRGSPVLSLRNQATQSCKRGGCLKPELVPLAEFYAHLSSAHALRTRVSALMELGVPGADLVFS